MNDQIFNGGEFLDGKYQIEKLLGQGGMGAVYRATHIGTRRTVAVKVIHPQFSFNEEFIERFRREAEAAGRLRHPNVVDVTDFGFAPFDNGRIAYLVMEFLDGSSLADALREEGKLRPSLVVDILEQVCSAVDEAHRLGIIHRDLKPDNIWLEPNRLGGYTVKVLDFGLVKLDISQAIPGKSQSSDASAAIQSGADTNPVVNKNVTLIKPIVNKEGATQIAETTVNTEGSTRILEAADPETTRILDNGKSLGPKDSAKENATLQIGKLQTADRKKAAKAMETAELTQIGSVMGTPVYMSPEQCRGENLGAASDIYSLGVIAYQMLAGETPYTGTVLELLNFHQTQEPPPLREKNSKVPRRMAGLVLSALSKTPGERPQSAAGFANALRVSTEGSGYLLRSAIALYSEHFPVFIKISLIAYTPLIIIVGALFLTDKVEIAGFYTNVGLFVAMIIANILAYFVVSAATVPVVIQLILAPLRRVNLKTAFAAIWKRRRVFIISSVTITALILLGITLFIIPGIIIAIFYVLYAPVVVMEDLGVRAALRRARQLIKRNWKTGLVITILQFALPVLVWYLSANLFLNLKLDDDWGPKEFGFSFAMSGTSSVYQLLNILVTPLTTIMTALLYLKTRRAGGESLREMAEELDRLEISASKWQKRAITK